MKERKIDMDKPINPFIKNQKLSVYIHNVKEKRLVNIEDIPTGDEIITDPEIVGITGKIAIDPVKHIKLFLFEGIENMFNLPKGAIKLLILIAKKLQWNQDLIKIELKKFSEEISMSESTVANGINTLVDSGFLCKYKRGYYWINPQVFFYGDRLKVYKEHLKQV